MRFNAVVMNKTLLKEKRKITPADAIRALNDMGDKISEKEAEEILDFLYIIS